jgi:DNA-binding transcriptional LysR family regulator
VNLSNLDLNLLLTLHVVLAERSVSRAAARLHVTSPAVSNALARLRDTLGDPLFVRKGRGLTPTPRALELQPTLAVTFGALERALTPTAFDPTTSTRAFSLALSDTDQLASLPAIARTFMRDLPRARLEIVSIDTLIASGGLSGSSIDAAAGPGTAEDGVHLRPLYDDDAVFVVRKEHPRVRRRLTPALFNAEGHVDVLLVLGKAGTGHRAAEDAFARYDLARRVAVTVPTFAAAAMVVASTDLLAGMPRRVAVTLARSLPLNILKPPMPALRFPMMLLWHERTQRDPACAYFRDLVARALAARADR